MQVHQLQTVSFPENEELDYVLLYLGLDNAKYNKM